MDAQLNFHPVTPLRSYPESGHLLGPSDLPEELPAQPGRYAAALAHEIRNPLTTINLATDMLESFIKDKELIKYLDIIKRNSIRINNAIYELLKYQATDKVKEKTYPIHLLLDEVLEMAGDRLRLKNILVRKEYAVQDCPMLSDRAMIKIALTNIIINAIDAMPSENGELTLRESSIDGKYALQIEDNGSGISKEDLECIFKPYFTKKPDGLGLGLSTTFDILQSDHVGIKVESEEGKGTRFILLFDKERFPSFLAIHP
jgi:signal transduction histidine kinase